MTARQLAAIPFELHELPRWVVWRWEPPSKPGEKRKKPPYPAAAPNGPRHASNANPEEAMFSSSGLVRGKWTERADYRERTIGAAIAATTEGYKVQRQALNAVNDEPEKEASPG